MRVEFLRKSPWVVHNKFEQQNFRDSQLLIFANSFLGIACGAICERICHFEPKENQPLHPTEIFIAETKHFTTPINALLAKHSISEYDE